MTRLAATIRHDLRLQFRYGFYHAAAFIVIVWVALMRGVPAGWRGPLLPVLVFLDLGLVGFYFVAGAVLFEKGEQTDSAMAVTPLRFTEYLTSKVITVTLLALGVSVVVALSAVGVGEVDWVTFVLGTALMSAISLLVGYITVVRYSSVTSFLLPSSVYLLILQIPLVDSIGWIKSPILYAIPTRASLMMLEAAFTGAEWWQLGLAIVYQAAWIYVLALWANRRRLQEAMK